MSFDNLVFLLVSERPKVDRIPQQCEAMVAYTFTPEMLTLCQVFQSMLILHPQRTFFIHDS